MFINTKPEAKIAVEIAHRYGFTRLTTESFYKRYDNNVFSPWSTDSDARAAQDEIAEAIRADRKAKRRPTPEAVARRAQEEREAVAHNISARTGEPYNNVLKRIL